MTATQLLQERLHERGAPLWLTGTVEQTKAVQSDWRNSDDWSTYTGSNTRDRTSHGNMALLGNRQGKDDIIAQSPLFCLSSCYGCSVYEFHIIFLLFRQCTGTGFCPKCNRQNDKKCISSSNKPLKSCCGGLRWEVETDQWQAFKSWYIFEWKCVCWVLKTHNWLDFYSIFLFWA